MYKTDDQEDGLAAAKGIAFGLFLGILLWGVIVIGFVWLTH